MRVKDILKLKEDRTKSAQGVLFTVTPEQTVLEAVMTMAAHDIGSLVVMEGGEVAGILTFREVLNTLAAQGGSLGEATVRKAMEHAVMTCTPETDVNEVRHLILQRHARYLPVCDNKMLLGVISLYDVANAVVEEQSFENRMLKAYIQDWPADHAADNAAP